MDKGMEATQSDVISFALSPSDFDAVSQVAAKLSVQSGVDIGAPGAFTIRNHSFKTDEPGVFCIRNHNFSIEKPGAYTIRNFRFSRGA